MAYNKDTDYQAIINQAVAQGDYVTAAKAEQSRNEKINDLNASGTNTYGATATNNYSSYLNNGTTSNSQYGTMAPNFQGSAVSVGVNNADQAAIKNQMNQNSIAWWSADDAGKAQLHAQNEYLASLLGGTVAWDESGDWTGNAAAEEKKPTFDYSVAKPTFNSNYAQNIDALLNQILNREDFSYNVENDPLYQQYATMYNREGNRAMNDTLASAAANAGGMNSYAVTAAQQASDYHKAQLTDKIPELYQLAYSMYLDDIDNQVRDLGLLQNMDNTQYDRYRDTMSDWYNDRDFAYNKYRDEVSDSQWGQSFNADQNNVAYNKALDFLSMGVMPDSALLNSAGITGDMAQSIMAGMTKPSGTVKPTYGDDVISVAAKLGYSKEEAQALKDSGSSLWYETLKELDIYTGDPSFNFKLETGEYRYNNPGTLFTNAEYNDYVNNLDYQENDSGKVFQISDALSEGKITEAQAKELMKKHGLSDQ